MFLAKKEADHAVDLGGVTEFAMRDIHAKYENLEAGDYILCCEVEWFDADKGGLAEMREYIV